MAQLEIRSQLWDNDGENLEWARGVSVHSDPIVPFGVETPLTITQGTDVWVRIADVSDSATIVHSGFIGKLFKNKH